jgi:hypothetical protein
MGDESDWEFVNDVDSKHSSEVLVEIPPGLSARNPPRNGGGEAASSVTSFSVVEKIKALKIKNGSSENSISSSYVDIGAENSEAASLSGATLGSLISSFDILSLSSGEVELHCKRCSSRYPVGTQICQNCYLALCANPCQNIDLQIAQALQIQEEKASLDEIVEKERRFLRLQNVSAVTQGNFLAKETLAYLRTKKLDNHFGIFKETDLTLLSTAFINSFFDDWTTHRKISLAFVCTYRNEWDNIRSNGFAGKTNILVSLCDKDPPVTPFDYSPPSSHLLQAIPENDSYQARPKHCWIVAIAESLESLDFYSNTLKYVEHGERILPLVCFDSCLSDSETIQPLVQGLEKIVDDFFQIGLQIGGAIYKRDPPDVLPSGETKRQRTSSADSPSPNNGTNSDPALITRSPFDIEASEHVLDKRTSFIFTNFPSHITEEFFLTQLRLGCFFIDFLFLPVFPNTSKRKDFAYVNFIDYKVIPIFYREYFSRHLSEFGCEMMYTTCQGKSQLLNFFMGSNSGDEPLAFVKRENGPMVLDKWNFPL